MCEQLRRHRRKHTERHRHKQAQWAVANFMEIDTIILLYRERATNNNCMHTYRDCCFFFGFSLSEIRFHLCVVLPTLFRLFSISGLPLVFFFIFSRSIGLNLYKFSGERPTATRMQKRNDIRLQRQNCVSIAEIIFNIHKKRKKRERDGIEFITSVQYFDRSACFIKYKCFAHFFFASSSSTIIIFLEMKL